MKYFLYVVYYYVFDNEFNNYADDNTIYLVLYGVIIILQEVRQITNSLSLMDGLMKCENGLRILAI